MNYWKKLPTWGQWVSGVVAGVAAIGIVIGWITLTFGLVHTQVEADEMEQQIYQVMADEKKADRIQRNRKDLSQLKRELVGEYYRTEGEKELIKLDIVRIEKELLCDEEKICYEVTPSE
jgi:uncharacterized membrane protein YciS (DUF1049 family)